MDDINIQSQIKWNQLPKRKYMVTMRCERVYEVEAENKLQAEIIAYSWHGDRTYPFEAEIVELGEEYM